VNGHTLPTQEDMCVKFHEVSGWDAFRNVVALTGSITTIPNLHKWGHFSTRYPRSQRCRVDDAENNRDAEASQAAQLKPPDVVRFDDTQGMLRQDMDKLVSRIKACFTHEKLNLKVGSSNITLKAEDFSCFALGKDETPTAAHWLEDTFVVLLMKYLLTTDSEMKDNVVLFDNLFAVKLREASRTEIPWSKDTRHTEMKHKVSPFNRKRM
jgi:hypothetical protein